MNIKEIKNSMNRLGITQSQLARYLAKGKSKEEQEKIRQQFNYIFYILPKRGFSGNNLPEKGYLSQQLMNDYKICIKKRAMKISKIRINRKRSFYTKCVMSFCGISINDLANKAKKSYANVAYQLNTRKSKNVDDDVLAALNKLVFEILEKYNNEIKRW